ncbi:MAG: DUF1073 domain-containing protein [Clostridium sp.]|nr:DUF1073 domain-containing protein [Clostridium sp.]
MLYLTRQRLWRTADNFTDPLNVKKIKGIDELRVYERAIVQPDYTAMFYGQPRYYQVSSISGFFTVHASRCLAFCNSTMPERTMNPELRYWGIPEYQRISRELRECSTAHGHAVKLLERAVQAVYSMKNLSSIVGTEDGEQSVLKRLQLIDLARGILNSIAIDSDGESYEFKSMQFNGVKDIIDTTCNMLSAVTSIPQTVLFGRSPAGMNATGNSDLENYYNLIERIQKMMLRGNLKTLVDVILRSALAKGAIKDKPKYRIEFNPLWSSSEIEQATVDQSRAQAAHVKAQTAQIYVDMGALDPSEVRKGLADDNEFDIEKLIDDIPEDDLEAAMQEPVATTAMPSIPAGTPVKFELPLSAGQSADRADSRGDGGPGSGRYPKGSGDKNKSSSERREKAKSFLPDADSYEASPSQGRNKQQKKYLRELGHTESNITEFNDIVKLTPPSVSNTDGKDTDASVGVLVLNPTGESILCGTRTDNKLICGAGGHIQEGETPAQAAIRETQEEFGITPTNLRRIGQITDFEGGKYGEPIIYLCTEFEGDPKASAEIKSPTFYPLDEMPGGMPGTWKLFPPFAESLKFLDKISENLMTNEGESDIINSNKTTPQLDGGDGSGRYPKGSGKKNHTLSAKDKQKYNARIVGKKTSTGTEITGFSIHAYQRIAERRVSPNRIEQMMAKTPEKSKTNPKCDVYKENGAGLVVDRDSGNIVTVMWTGK